MRPVCHSNILKANIKLLFRFAGSKIGLFAAKNMLNVRINITIISSTLHHLPE